MNHLIFKYGLLLYAGFAGLFLVFYFLGLASVVELRALNGVLHFGILYLLIRDYRVERPETIDNYVSGVVVGMMASAIGVVAFTVSMLLFLTINNPFFLELRAKSPLPDYFTPFTASLYIFVEGIAISLIGAYLIARIVDARYEGKRGNQH